MQKIKSGRTLSFEPPGGFAAYKNKKADIRLYGQARRFIGKIIPYTQRQYKGQQFKVYLSSPQLVFNLEY